LDNEKVFLGQLKMYMSGLHHHYYAAMLIGLITVVVLDKEKFFNGRIYDTAKSV